VTAERTRLAVAGVVLQDTHRLVRAPAADMVKTAREGAPACVGSRVRNYDTCAYDAHHGGGAGVGAALDALGGRAAQKTFRSAMLP
jgi:hypothetical protein